MQQISIKSQKERKKIVILMGVGLNEAFGILEKRYIGSFNNDKNISIERVYFEALNLKVLRPRPKVLPHSS